MKFTKLVLIIGIIAVAIYYIIVFSQKRFEKLDAYWQEQEKYCEVAHVYSNGSCIPVNEYEYYKN